MSPGYYWAKINGEGQWVPVYWPAYGYYDRHCPIPSHKGEAVGYASAVTIDVWGPRIEPPCD